MKGFTIKCNNCSKSISVDEDLFYIDDTNYRKTEGIETNLSFENFKITCECGNTIEWY